MILLKASFNASTPYDYYHLISSVDMPLMTPNEIDDFFEKNKGKEFVRIFGNGEQHGEANWRMHYRYPFITRYKRSKYEPISKKSIDFSSIKVQEISWNGYCKR